MSSMKEIVATLNELLNPYSAVVVAEADAKAATDKAKADSLGFRLALMGQISEKATEKKWREEDLRGAIKIISKSGEQSDKSKAVLISQIASAAHPRVREHFAKLAKVVNETCDDQEAIADAKNPNPLRALAPRRYGLMYFCCNKIAAGTMEADFTAEDLLALAEVAGREKKLDAKAAAKKIATIIKQIEELDKDFSSPQLLNAAEELRELTEQKLIEARDKPKGVAAPPGQPAAGKGRAKPVFVHTSGEASGVEA